jgi:hypothetical protein
MTPNLIRDITSHILNAPDRTAATGKGIRILAKMHARKDRQMPTATKLTPGRIYDVDSLTVADWTGPREILDAADFASVYFYANYFTDGEYLGADADGVEPLFDGNPQPIQG